MKPLPWRTVKLWKCVRCGECCSLTVQLTMSEWLNLTRMYGFTIADQDISGFFLRKTLDNKCPFLLNTFSKFRCGLQNTKLMACKIWPFRVLTEPKYGEADEALFTYRDKKFYIYVLPTCSGITWGRPTERLSKKVLPELIDIRFGFLQRQYFSTSF
ncbi:MAG: YkgJ family cysteine cluster protein [Candidatus Bathyarchaeota archaeon]